MQQHLLRTDPRRIGLEELVQRDKGRGETDELSDADRGVIVGAARAASSEWEREQARARSFRDLLYMATSVLFVLAIAVTVVAGLYHSLLPLCFNPVEDDRVVCPTRSGPYVDENLAINPNGGDVNDAFAANASPLDYALVAGVGLLAAAVAAATTLRRIRGTSTPYGIPVALAVFKLPTGALTAVLGLVLMRGQFVPGLSALDSSAQIVAWAAVSGYSQQLFTRLVDERGQAVLNAMGSAETTDSSRYKTPQT